MGWARGTGGTWILCAVSALVAGGCATIPDNRYGVSSLEFTGVEQMDPQALKACLATHERPWFQISLGRTAEPECAVPPFDSDRIRMSFWRWPWTEWPLYDRSVWERDVERIERWYEARGYYDAQVVSTEIRPPDARRSDRISDDENVCAEGEGEGCEVFIEVAVEEGEPVLVTSVALQGIDSLPPDVQTSLRDAVALQEGERFDEARYDNSKDALRNVLADASYARAEVSGTVRVDRDERTAEIDFRVEPGPECVFGPITVTGEEDLPADVIEAAALIEPGDEFSRQAIGEAQRAIYALGAFSTVEVEPQYPPEDDPEANVLPLTIRVTPGRLVRFGLGAGFQVGTFEYDVVEQSVRQWDIHLLGLIEFRNFLGGLRRLRIEERPRLIFQDQTFPQVGNRRLGNDIRLEFRQPAFLEPRTDLVFNTRWDLGPDPFRGYFRHDINVSIGPERNFFDGRLFLALRLHENIFIPTGDQNLDVNIPSSYDVMFLEQTARVDLRDDPRNPRNGAYFAATVHEAGFFMPASWSNYIRFTPEVRGYLGLPFGLVLAARFGVGFMVVEEDDSKNDPSLDPISTDLGPERYRLRGGGATSNRGYLPGDLGDSAEGGLRRWEASLELRVPITANFGAALFADMGDVYDGFAPGESPALAEPDPRFRWSWIHLSAGLGLRYRTIVGPIRFDVGWQVPEAQVLGEPDYVTGRSVDNPKTRVNFFFFDFPGAVHLTIGEAF